MSDARAIMHDGLWRQNAGLVQLLGLCPVLVISSNVVNAVSLGLATCAVMMLSGMAVASLRRWIPQTLRVPIFMLIIATLVTVVDLLFSAYAHGLYRVLGIFIPLITTNCIVLARAEVFASRQPVARAALDGAAMGAGLTAVLAVLGALRELAAQGTLLSGIDLVFGAAARGWVIQVTPADAHYQFLLAALPPGAFFGLAFLIAGKSAWDRRIARRTGPAPLATVPDGAGG
ncbi:electron transport complex subunit E [Chitiniphilus purpureus]|uniref:Ion-translocating oxidoreductase complex subunit E n=1 Tax=Chitiniphilus purpureus TaxID=2981137 RepID=A0ABY6DHC8_9NEIS|nr:electron transport complex subunit E [Chitiniphilus sp. CD1]UXY13638.1 electron transport complex subunit E [Chitiniphilus sp. CD1]